MQRLPECCLIDTSVLLSVVKREIILFMVLDGLLNVRWSEAIFEEMRKALHRLFLKKYGNVLDAHRNSLRVYNWIKTALPSCEYHEDCNSFIPVCRLVKNRLCLGEVYASYKYVEMCAETYFFGRKTYMSSRSPFAQ